MPCSLNRYYVPFLVTLLGPLLATAPAHTQSITPADTATTIQQTGTQYQIDGGNLSGDSATLFHSFDQFGLLTGESAQFSNPVTVENIVGRVLGGDASIIDGLLAVDGNANLYLLNPAGIFLGENTQLNLGGSFSASTATGLTFGNELLNALGSNDYGQLTGAPTGYAFDTETGAIVNAGDLAVTSGQSLTLLGGQVINTGQLAASGGEVLVMAVPGENRVRLSQDGSLLGLELETLPDAAPTAAFTPTTVPALLTGAGALGMATDITVNPDGTVSLSGSSLQIPTDPGTAIVSGQLEADSGNIGVLGEQIALVGATVDASGDAGGGTILIGGDELGNGAVPNAATTIIDENSVIQADARDTGNGGKIVAWGTNLLRSAGQLFARGGTNGGDGGFIETSSLGLLDVRATPDVSAVNGAGGLWLLDPANIRIVAGNGLTNIDNTPGTPAIPEMIIPGLPPTPPVLGPDGSIITPGFPGTPDTVIPATPATPSIFSAGAAPPDSSILGVDLITNALTGGSNVEIITTGNTPGNGNISLEVPLDYNFRNGSLSLQAEGSIDIQANIFDSLILAPSDAVLDNLILTLQANEQISISGDISIGTGDLTISSAQGNIDVTGRLATTSGAVSIQAPQGKVTVSGVIHTSLNRFNDALGATGENLIADTPGGDVTVSALRAVEVDDIITSSNGSFAGNVSLESQISTVQAGSILASSDTINGTLTVAITHAGAAPSAFGTGFISFEIGDNSVNGTAGIISLGESTFENEVFFGNTRVEGFEDIGGGTTVSTGEILVITSTSIEILDSAGELIGQAAELATGELVGRISSPTGTRDLEIDQATGVATETNTRQNIGQATASNINLSLTELSAGDTISLVAEQSPVPIQVIEFSTAQALGQVELAENTLTGEITNPTGNFLPFQTPGLGNIEIDSATGVATDVNTGETVGQAVDVASLTNLLPGDTIELIAEERPVGIDVVESSTTQTLGQVELTENALTREITNPAGNALPFQTPEFRNIEIDSTTGIATDIDTGENVGQAANIPSLANLMPGETIELIAAEQPVDLGIIDSSTAQPIGQTTGLTENVLTSEIVNPTNNLIATITNPTTGLLTNVEIDTATGLAIDSATGDTVGQITNVAGLTNLAAGQNLEIALVEPSAPPPLPPPVTPPPNETGPVIPPEADELAASCISDCGEAGGTGSIGRIPSGAITVLPAPELAIQQFEQQLTTEVADHLGLEDSNNDSGSQVTGSGSLDTPDLPTAQAKLREVQGQIGERPALIYAVFGNAAGEANDVLRTNAPSDPLELLLVTADGEPKYIQLPVTRGEVLDLAHRFRRQVTSPSRVGTQTYLPVAQELYQLLIAPLEAELAAQEIDTISFITDAGLRSVPLAALHDGENFLVENYNVGLMPSLGLTDLTYQDIRNVGALVAGTSVFADQVPLPGVPLELESISSQWNSALLQGDTFSLDQLQGERQQNSYGIIHLATHGEFNAGDLSKSYLHLHNERLGLDQLRAIGLHKPAVELITLSACQTALGSHTAELGFAGFAVLAGAKTAVASLWSVSDEASAGLMIEFYEQLQGNQPIIKAEALRQAQLAMIRGDIAVDGDRLKLPNGSRQLPLELAEDTGQDFSHPYYWAAFSLIGSPW
ncbi:MAG: CHAT domain-containing protein [Cyanobacteria bacterium J06656_5]